MQGRSRFRVGWSEGCVNRLHLCLGLGQDNHPIPSHSVPSSLSYTIPYFTISYRSYRLPACAFVVFLFFSTVSYSILASSTAALAEAAWAPCSSTSASARETDAEAANQRVSARLTEASWPSRARRVASPLPLPLPPEGLAEAGRWFGVRRSSESELNGKQRTMRV